MNTTKNIRTNAALVNSLHASSIAHFVIGKDHTVIEWNRACEVLTGYSSSRMRGTKDHWRPFYPVRHPCLSDLLLNGATERTIRAHFRGMKVSQRELLKGAYGVEGYFPSIKNGGRWLRMTAAKIKNSAGKVIAVIETVEDITERRQAVQEMVRLNKELLKTNAQLRRLALCDPQTGLYNHRYLKEALDAEILRSRRYEQPLSLIMMDVDYFRSVNDIYGHTFGDLILEQLAGHLKRLVRRYDIVCRYGGEEFVVISPGTDRFQALMLAQRIMDECGLETFGDKKRTVKLKLSLGVASFPEERIVESMDLVKFADTILEKAKEDGGNRVYSSADVKRLRTGRHTKERKSGKEDVCSLRHKLGKVTKQAHESLIESIFAFAKAIEIKDHYTGEHVERTVQYATRIAKMMGYTPGLVEAVKQASILHDLGKIGVSDQILLKKGKLTDEEYNDIKKHPQIAADILRPIKFLQSVIPYILYHHERWDGKGYPSGLRGEMIPVGARIISVADVFQALISNRPYRKAFTKREALKIIKEGAGTQFDPKIVKAFMKLVKGK